MPCCAAQGWSTRVLIHIKHWKKKEESSRAAWLLCTKLNINLPVSLSGFNQKPKRTVPRSDAEGERKATVCLDAKTKRFSVLAGRKLKQQTELSSINRMSLHELSKAGVSTGALTQFFSWSQGDIKKVWYFEMVWALKAKTRMKSELIKYLKIHFIDEVCVCMYVCHHTRRSYKTVCDETAGLRHSRGQPVWELPPHHHLPLT